MASDFAPWCGCGLHRTQQVRYQSRGSMRSWWDWYLTCCHRWSKLRVMSGQSLTLARHRLPPYIKSKYWEIESQEVIRLNPFFRLPLWWNIQSAYEWCRDFDLTELASHFINPNKWGIDREDRWGSGEIDTSLVAIGEVSYEFCRVKNYMPKLDNGGFVV